jgi:Cysteine rich repeat
VTQPLANPSLRPMKIGHCSAALCKEAQARAVLDAGAVNEVHCVASPCRNALEQVMAERALDFRLDVHVRTECATDMATHCVKPLKSALTGWNAVHAGGDGNYHIDDVDVMACLQKSWNKLNSPRCRAAVRATMARAVADVRFAPRVASLCAGDIARLCARVKPVCSSSAHVCIDLVNTRRFCAAPMHM